MATNALAVLTDVTTAQANAQYPPLVAYVFQRVLENQPGALRDLTTYLGNKLEKFVGKSFEEFSKAFSLDKVTESLSGENQEKWRIFLEIASKVIIGGQRFYDEDGCVVIAQAVVPTR